MIAALFIAGSTFAQTATTDTKDPLKEEAMQQTNDLDAIVNLTEEQRSKVFEVYTGALRQQEAMKQRYEGAEKDMEADKPYIDQGIQRQVGNKLNEILDEEQYNAWKLSTK